MSGAASSQSAEPNTQAIPATPLTSTQYVLSHPPSPAPSSSFETTSESRSSEASDRTEKNRAQPANSTTSNSVAPYRRSLEDEELEQELEQELESYSLDHHQIRPHSLASGSGSGSGSGSFGSDSALEVLDHDEELDEQEDLEMMFDDDEFEADVGEPLVSRSRGRRRRRWNHDEEKQEKGLIELIPSLVLAHPLPLLPLLALLPYNFLPAGVVFFIPIFCVLAVLSACAHIVIVYLAWYLKVTSFEEVFAAVTAKYGKYGLWTGRGFVVAAVLGAVVSWLETLHPLLQPVIETYAPNNAFWSSRVLWTCVASATLLPSLLPSRMTRSLRRSPIVLALLIPVVAFLVIGRTVEIKKASELPQPIGDVDGSGDGSNGVEAATEILGHLVKRRFGLAGGSSAGAGLTTLTIFLSPHINTLPIHASLIRSKRASFPMPCLIAAGAILALCLPLALVPYYLLPPLDADALPAPSPTTPSGVFARLPADDGWVNIARILMCAIALGSSNMWILRGRDTILKAMGVDHGEREKAGKWVGLGMWTVMVAFACLGGWVAEKVELLGVLAILAVAWFLPSLFFIITFHVRSPLSIIFPSSSRQPTVTAELAPATPSSQLSRRGMSMGHSRTDSLNDPTTDVLLARKERQLQKRRLGRRLWQDLIVYVGILPVGSVSIAWTFGRLLGVW
ncbi:hypothetical protein I316_05232 [Kwoniella heveanensis BCC8398]|uniref:Uncharacterized protein n=1 Tax=Kwoniella heveanensis BCC8398 TaxID=1296120 RepID=A0A1B9GQA0_9TREE|nr:hypothetical protein I316_05232 [Kwoniella heveanensis BCC8398]